MPSSLQLFTIDLFAVRYVCVGDTTPSSGHDGHDETPCLKHISHMMRRKQLATNNVVSSINGEECRQVPWVGVKKLECCPVLFLSSTMNSVCLRGGVFMLPEDNEKSLQNRVENRWKFSYSLDLNMVFCARIG